MSRGNANSEITVDDAPAVIYFDHKKGPLAECRDASVPFRTGEAGLVWVSDEGTFETDTQVTMGPNSYHSLVAHDVVGRLSRLDHHMGPIAEGREAVLSPAALPEALRIFYEADRMTYGARHDLLVAASWGNPPADYRIVIDNREYQQTLSRLQFLTSQASRWGQSLRLKL